MSEQQLITIGTNQIEQIWGQLTSDLQALRDSGISKKIGDAVDVTLAQLAADRTEGQDGDLAAAYKNALKISHTLGLLSIAANQRSRTVRYRNQGQFAVWIRQLLPGLFSLEPTLPDLTKELNQIELLIQSCYQPFRQFLLPALHPKTKKREIIFPEQILAVYFQEEFLARPDRPVPFLIAPNYFQGEPKQWTGVGHETGHHIYRQVPGLREELEVMVGRMLRNSSVIVNGRPIREYQQRLWFNYLEESFADLIGVLSLGAAFVYTGHVMIRSYATDKESRGVGKPDLTHPIPILRGEMGNYMYEKLLRDSGSLDHTYLDDLQQEWQQVTNNLPDKSLHDPHTPLPDHLLDEWNASGKLDYDETITVMKLFVDTMLDTKLESVGCKSLGEMFDFAGDELKRTEAKRTIRAGAEFSADQDVRIQVAAQQLALHPQNP